MLFAGVATIPAAAQTDTMQFRYNAQHTGDFSSVAGNTSLNNVQKWDYTTGYTRGDNDVYWMKGAESSPAVANGTVYVGSYDGKVYALDAATGVKVWQFTTRGWVRSSPTVVNGVVYIGSDDHKVYALNAQNGTQLWNFSTGGFVISSPAIVNGVVYIGSDDHKYAIGNPSAPAADGGSPISGFEVTLAFVGLVIAAYAVKRKS